MKTILITGATSGFGKLLTRAFLEEGHEVIATGRDLLNRREALREEREKFKERLIEVSMDVTNDEEIAKAVSQISSAQSKIDILINNAGYGLFGSLEDTSEELLRYQMEVNFFGTVKVLRGFLPLLRQARGKIFNFSSVFGFMGFPLTSAYCASKFAVEGLTESLRGELAPFGVQVCLIEPGAFRTGFASNVNWAQKTGSLYQQQFENYRHVHTELAPKRTQPPEVVVRGIVRLSRKKKLPMRKTFGKDACLSWLSRRLLPSGAYFSLMDLVFKRVFVQGLFKKKV